jgi:hypothetical protein
MSTDIKKILGPKRFKIVSKKKQVLKPDDFECYTSVNPNHKFRITPGKF